jgi:hypothetical protein
VRAPTSKRIDEDLLPLGGLAALLLIFLLWPFIRHGFRLPLGPDAPVYLWWTRLAGHDGLSAVGSRPGVPALLLVLTRMTHLPLAAVTAALEMAMGVGVGLGAVGVVRVMRDAREGTVPNGTAPRSTRDRPEWLLAGLLCGIFSVHLVAGYMANLAFAVAFLAAVAALATGTRRGAVAAAIALGGGGLSHPQFFILGTAILLLAAVPFLARDRDARPWVESEFGRVTVAVLGGAALLGAGLLSMLSAPRPPDVDTSKDAFLRRLGLSGELRGAYWDRFLDRWARYVQWASIPLAVVGLPGAAGFAGSVLLAWSVASIAGVAIALSTGWFPADRFVTFCYAVPILAALGLVRLGRSRAAPRPLAIGIGAVLVAVMVLGAAIAWGRQAPFISPDEVRAATDAGRFLSGTPEGTTAAFVVVGGSDSGAFELARAGNVIRSALPPERIRSAIVVAPCAQAGLGPPSAAAPGDALANELASLSCRTIEEASRAGALIPLLLRPFAGTRDDAFAAEGTTISPDVRLLRRADAAPSPSLSPSPDRPRPSIDALTVPSTGMIAIASIIVLTLLWIVGYGWARACIGPGTTGIALAPAFGVVVTTIAGVVVDRLGFRLGGSTASTVAAASACACGYLAALLLERRVLAKPPSKIHDQPRE